jgi:ribosomal protein S18 acetylase RimI-like enzyme
MDEGVKIRLFREADAAGVAELLNASDSTWPGTFTGGIAYSAERVLEHRREGDYLLDLVAEAEGKIVGSCILTRDWSDPQAAYVSFLDVHPEWHGKGIGKGLLLRAVEEAIRRGFPYLVLNTWAGNERAVPLYKKAGFFWIPGTSVRMENYLPQVLSLPWVQEFLEDTHWYDCLRRKLTLEEDREKWRGREVFRYRWERNGKVLEVVIDRAAKAPCALLAPEFSAEVWPEPAEPWGALPFRLHWRLENKGQSTLNLGISAWGESGIELAGGELVALSPGEERVGECEGRLAPQLEREPRRPLPAAKLRLITPTGVVELAAGMKGELPVEVSWGPAPRFVLPAAPQRAKLFLTNHQKSAVTGKLSLLPPQGLALHPHAWEFHLGPGETRALEVEIEAQPGGYALTGRVELSSGESWDIPRLPVLSRAPGQVAGCLLEKRAVVAGDWGWVEARAQGGRLIFFRYGEQHPELRQGEELGPPFYPAELGQRRWQLQLAREGEALVLIQEASSGRVPGLSLKKRVVFSPGHLVRIEYVVSSRREGPHPVRLRIAHWDLPDRPWWISFRAQEGLIHEPLGSFPEGEGDFPRKLAEEWLALEAEGWAIGLLPTGEVEWDCDWGWSWKTKSRQVPAGESIPFHSYCIYLGPGDAEEVRRRWGEQNGLHPEPEQPHPLVWVDPPGPFLVGRTGELALRVRTARGQPFSGKLRLSPPRGLSLTKEEVELEGVLQGKPAEIKVRWQKDGPPRAGTGELVLEGMGEKRRFPWPLIFLPQEGPKGQAETREGREIFVISAGRTELRVAPEFAGSLISWQRDGTEWFLSAFPSPRPFVWFSPWFGGIHPVLHELSLDEWTWPGRLHEEEFAGELWRGEVLGVPASGVRLRCSPSGKGLEGLSLEVLYASPGEGILLSLLRIRNQGRPRHLSGGFWGFLAPSGEHRNTELRSPERTRVPSPYHAWYEAHGWALVQAPGGEGLLGVAQPFGTMSTWDAGEEGRHFGIEREFQLDPGQETSLWCWWVALGRGEDPTPWLALSQVSPDRMDEVR